MTELILFAALFFTRIYGLFWGAPYFFHPDENNMAASLSSLTCPNILAPAQCLEPGFYAYGQVYLYLAKIILPIAGNANYSLRIVSAFFAICSGFYFLKLIKQDFKNKLVVCSGFLLFIFTPAFIQFSHFGTTEAGLILIVILMLYYRRQSILLFLLAGVAVSIKISAIILFLFPFYQALKKKMPKRQLLKALVMASLTFIILTPHYFLNFDKFLDSFQYEASVASGKLPVFYTTQFIDTNPFLFPLIRIFPYALGLPIIILALVGIFSLVMQKKSDILVLFAFLYIFSLTTFVKWTRFWAFVFPIFVYFSSAGLAYLKKRLGRFTTVIIIFVVLAQILIGSAIFGIYLYPDSRIQANSWIKHNIPYGASVITESANVVDLPMENSKYQVESYFLYDLDRNTALAKTVFKSLHKADYVIVPSRRVFANYTCYYFCGNKPCYRDNCSLGKKYPKLNKYYWTIFESGKFELVKTVYQRTDEQAEETFSVFDHPTIRIYKQR
jgi:hypothetical protein